MKKTISFIVVLISCCIALTACGQKRVALTTDEFKSKMKDAGYELMDATDQFPEGAVKSVQLAMKETHQIEFYEVLSEEQGLSAFNENKQSFLSVKESSASESSVTIGNYSMYSLNSGGKFYYTARIGATVIYIATDKSNKDAVKAELKNLGY